MDPFPFFFPALLLPPSASPVVVCSRACDSNHIGAALSARDRVSVTKAQDLYRKSDPSQPLARLAVTGSALIKQRLPSGAFQAIHGLSDRLDCWAPHPCRPHRLELSRQWFARVHADLLRRAAWLSSAKFAELVRDLWA